MSGGRELIDWKGCAVMDRGMFWVEVWNGTKEKSLVSDEEGSYIGVQIDA